MLAKETTSKQDNQKQLCLHIANQEINQGHLDQWEVSALTAVSFYASVHVT